MTWRELSDFLHSQRRALCPRPLHEFSRDGERQADTFKRLENSTRAVLDRAVRDFAATGKWPELPDEATLILYFRLSYAVDLAVALGKCKTGLFLTGKDQDSKMLEWALIDAWDYPGLPHTLRMSFKLPHPTSQQN